MKVKNRFGEGEIYSFDDIVDSKNYVDRPIIYCTSTACLSVTSDMKSLVSNHEKTKEAVFVKSNNPASNNIIIVLGCQVTDLAILNDIKTVERLHEENPKAQVYMGGCLAYRFDIELPSYVKRLGASRSEYTPINESLSSNITWEKPFWINNWTPSSDEMAPGNIFRNMYPLKIGAGCFGKCKYCTIRDTRGEYYHTDAYLQVREFIEHDNVVLVSDSPTTEQIKDWCTLAKRYNKPISIRNIEPRVTCECEEELLVLSVLGLLKFFHCPIQSENPELLKIMNRNIEQTEKAIEIMGTLRKIGTKVATNIIIDYTTEVEGKKIVYKNMNVEWLNSHFDYWSWNPYFDGRWNRENAEARFQKYITNNEYT